MEIAAIREDGQLMEALRWFAFAYRNHGRIGCNTGGELSRLQAIWKDRTSEYLFIEEALRICRELFATGLLAMEC